MKQVSKLLLLLTAAFFSTGMYAQKCDPWITKAYNQLYGRGPSAAECNIKNYNNGSWGSYAELVGHIAGFNRQKPGNHLKGDPWIFQAYAELYNRAPQPFELNVQHYNRGSWANYNELKALIQELQKDLSANSLRALAGTVNGKPAAALVDPNNNLIALNLVSHDGGNVVAPGGANVIATGGGNVVAAGGLNLQFNANTPGITFGNDRTIQSAGTRVIKTAGKTTLVIR